MSFAGAILRNLRQVFQVGAIPGESIPVVAERWGLLKRGLAPIAGGLILGTATRWTVKSPGNAGQQLFTDPDEADGTRWGIKPIKAFALWFGGNVSAANRFLIAQGTATEVVASVSGVTTRATVPIACSLARVLVLANGDHVRLEIRVNGATVVDVSRQVGVFSSDLDSVFAVEVPSGVAALAAGDYVEVFFPSVTAASRALVLLTASSPGHLYPWGANFTAANGFAAALGKSGTAQAASGVTTRLPCAFAGTLTHVAFSRTTVAADTVIRVHNGTAATSQDVTLPAAGNQGFVALGTPLAVAEGDRMEVEFLSGTAPGATTLTVRLLPTDTARTGYVDWFGGNPAGAKPVGDNYGPMNLLSATLPSAGDPAAVASLSPRFRSPGLGAHGEGEGGNLHSIVGRTATGAIAPAAVQIGPAVALFDIPISGRTADLNLESLPGDMALLSPDVDGGETSVGIYWE